jgi:RNA polymerase sigma-70 factor (ECF subfamily)
VIGVQEDRSDPIPSDDDLASLLANASRGDPAAWFDLVNRYARRIYALARSRCGNHDVAEELTQSVFATLAEKLPAGGYDERGRFEAWLFRVAANRVRDHVRRGRLRHVSQDPETLDREHVARDAYEPGESNATELADLRAAMHGLTEADREVIELRHHGGLSFKQIAELLDEPLGTLLARHHRALRKLRETMERTTQSSRPAAGDRSKTAE